jgi:regulator of RNase E activity RraB
LNGVKAFKVVFEIGEQEKLEAKDMKGKIWTCKHTYNKYDFNFITILFV